MTINQLGLKYQLFAENDMNDKSSSIALRLIFKIILLLCMPMFVGACLFLIIFDLIWMLWLLLTSVFVSSPKIAYYAFINLWRKIK